MNNHETSISSLKGFASLNPIDLHSYLLSQTFDSHQLPYDTHQVVIQNDMRWKQVGPARELDDAVYNLVMSADQTSLLAGTRQTMRLFNCENGLQLVNTFCPHNITWTMTDCDISDDSTIAISCSLNPYISLYDLHNSKVLAHLNLRYNNCSTGNIYTYIISKDDQIWVGYYGVTIYTCKLSADKSSLLAGTGRSGDCAKTLIQFYDIEKNKVIHSIQAHNNDINSIAFTQREQSSVFISGSDDSFLKVWDIRTLGLSSKPVGICYGHFSGVTHVDSRNDGVYVCSNSKDQSLKLWDLRKLSTDENLPHKYLNFDYRYGKPEQSIINEYRKYAEKKEIHYDSSVCSYTSHYVVQTLIRCHFSPLKTTGRQYMITASSCGQIFIYSMFDPSQPPVIINPCDNSNQIIPSSLMLDQDFSQQEEDWESIGMDESTNNEDLFIIRDVNWNDNTIVSGDFRGVVREYQQI